MNYTQLLDESRKIGLPVDKILEVFVLLQNAQKIENNELIKKTGVSGNVLNLIKKDFVELFTPVSDTTSLNKKGNEGVESLISGLVTENTLAKKRLKDILKIIESSRPETKREYDQFLATVETVKNRAELLQKFADIKQKRVAFLGDDDFTSVAVASLGLAGNITVFDIDARILKIIQNVSDQEKFGIKTVPYDAKDKLPDVYRNDFDVVFTDPPYTSHGIELFLSRATHLLDNKNLAARVYLCFGNSDRAKERFLPVYEIISRSGFMMRFVFDKFNRYYGAGSIGSTSSLFILEVTPQTRVNVKGEYDYGIYTTK